MSRKLIDRDELIASIPKTNVDIFENCRNCSTLCDWQVRELIEQAELVDAVEVVRCGECIHHEEPRDTFLKAFVWCNFYNTHKLKNGYCNCGERQDEEEQNDEID